MPDWLLIGTNTPMPDSDPLDQCNGHGTHVGVRNVLQMRRYTSLITLTKKGIIGANPGNEFNISGVAYEASLSAYRIFGCTGDTTDDSKLWTGFLEECLTNVLQSSLKPCSKGSVMVRISWRCHWVEPMAGPRVLAQSCPVVLPQQERLLLSQRVCADDLLTGACLILIETWQGNDGAKGSWYTSSPGNAINAISVASTDNTVIPLQNATVFGVEHDPITYFDTFPLPVNSTLPIFATSTDTTVEDDACNPLPDDTPDLSQFVVIIRRGGCSFVCSLWPWYNRCLIGCVRFKS